MTTGNKAVAKTGQVTAAAASGVAKPSSSNHQVPLSSSSARTRVSSGSPNGNGDTDSDSGISVDSYTKALKIDVGGGNAASGAASLPPPPPPPNPGTSAASATTATSKHSSPPTAATDAGSIAAPPSHPEYATMIQEALCSLSESTSGAGGCSLLNVLLYILNKYEDADDGNVQVIHAKVKSGLQFLKRMGIIEKCGLNGEGGDASSDEDTAALPSRGVLAATASASDASDGDKAKAKAKEKAANKILNKAKTTQIKTEGGGFRVVMMSPQKLGLLGGKAKPKKSSNKKAPTSTDDGATNKVKREINSRPKRL